MEENSGKANVLSKTEKPAKKKNKKSSRQRGSSEANESNQNFNTRYFFTSIRRGSVTCSRNSKKLLRHGISIITQVVFCMKWYRAK